jgi:hypothetical protein
METAKAVGDGRLTDEEIGIPTRRLIEIIRRINEGALDRRDTMRALQMLIEGKAKQMVEPCSRPHRSESLKFKMLPPAERRKSRAPLRMRSEQYRKRLYFHYRAFFSKRKSWTGKALHPEDIIALMWEAENIPHPGINHGWTPVQSILSDFNASEHDRAIVASTLQWLGTNVGQDFLRRMVATAGLDV